MTQKNASPIDGNTRLALESETLQAGHGHLLDLGAQSGQIANQTRILALGNDIRARVNTLYMAPTFGGGAVGSFAGAFAWSGGGWHGVCTLALFLIATGALVLMLGVRAQGGDPHSHGA